jgi:2-polyprenyl-3-methyl-5-hydroxy-6-metoxy-1,4-benzoquinol methylase
MPDLSRRDLQPEEMDRPDLDAGRHAAALRALERINAVSRSAALYWPAIRDLARCTGRSVHVLDVATGGGDVPCKLWNKARRAGLPVAVSGCDRSDTALAIACRNAERHRAAVEFFAHDALSGPLPDCDVLTCSLFLHHLTEDEATDFLRRAAAAARHLLLVNDLRRSATGFAMAHVACRLLTRSPVVRADGPQSVAAAFTLGEAADLARQAGLRDFTLARHWPFRFLLTVRTGGLP